MIAPFFQPHTSPPSHPININMQGFSESPLAPQPLSLSTPPPPSPAPVDDRCWGWLEPAPKSRTLPHVMLRGATVCIGRGGDAVDFASLSLPGRSGDATPTASDSPQAGAFQFQTPSVFVEIADRGVFRAHSLLFAGKTSGGAGAADSGSSSSS